MKTAHTPGPWTIYAPAGTDSYYVSGPGSLCVFTIRAGTIPMRDDARLIAAAPELLTALRNLVAAATPHADALVMFACVERARAAIEKAEGRT